jgi:hypothetical protein
VTCLFIVRCKRAGLFHIGSHSGAQKFHLVREKATDQDTTVRLELFDILLGDEGVDHLHVL